LCIFSVNKIPQLMAVGLLSCCLRCGLRRAAPDPSPFPATRAESRVAARLRALLQWALSLETSVLFCLSQRFGLLLLPSLFWFCLVGVGAAISLTFCLTWMWYFYSNMWALILWLYRPGQ